ncbi:GH3 auxin-responsive promoter family protein [Patescibacteria group bacterium]
MNILPIAMKIRGKLIFAPHLEKFSKNPTSTQSELLLKIVKENQDTAFGKDHNFSEIHSIADFQKNVPIQEYKDLLPYVERHKKGEKHVLTMEEPAIYALTSGSTGKPKYIPITPSFIKEYSNISTLWLYNILRDHPHVYDGDIFAVMPPPTSEKTAGGTPLGTISGYIQKNLPSFVLSHYVVDEEYLRGVTGHDDLYYIWMRLGMEADVTLMIIINPATHLLLAKKGNEWCEDILKDIEEGTLKKDVKIPAKTRQLIESKLQPNPKRAAELRKIYKKNGCLYPKDYWPNLAVSVCWKSGSMATFLPQLPQYYGEVAVRDLGLSATEARICTPLQDEGAHGVLTVDNNFFEFIPEEHLGEENPPVVLTDELKIDHNYSVIVTPLNGLYRYNLNDIIRVVGYYNKTPLVEFIHKGKGYSSLTGEKLSEWQIMRAVHDCSRELDLPIDIFLAYGDTAEPQHYVFCVGFKHKPNEGKQQLFLDTVDEKLQKFNIEYKKRRGTGRLGAPEMQLIDGLKIQETYHQIKLSQGFHDSQMKFPALITDYNNHDFEELKKNGMVKH